MLRPPVTGESTGFLENFGAALASNVCQCFATVNQFADIKTVCNQHGQTLLARATRNYRARVNHINRNFSKYIGGGGSNLFNCNYEK